MLSRLSRSFTLAPLALLVGCAGGTITPGGGGAAGDVPGQPHLMLTRAQSRGAETQRGGMTVTPDAVPAAAKLTYRGGPIMANVNVNPIYWGNGVQFSGGGSQSLNAFYAAVIQSPYYDWLNEYNTPTQTLGEGTFNKSFNYTNGATGSITDSQISSALGQLIDNGSVAKPTANTYYPIHFAPGISITMSDGSASCQVFCAYHNSFTHNGVKVYYGVMPDQGGSCAGGCGGDPSLFNNTTSVSSHELVEATTDADVGNNDLAWYDDANGEIGDICNAQQGTAAGFVVQKEWSNQANACIDHKGTTTTNDFSIAASPSSLTVKAGASGTVTVTTAVVSGSPGTITLGATGLPSGVTASFNPTSVSAGGSSTLTITAAAQAASASANVSVTGQTSTKSHSASVALTVQGATTPPPPPPPGNCSHDICKTGGKLVKGCDPCVTKICGSDPYCCNTQWDNICVGEVQSICGQSTCSTTPPPPGGGGNCTHPICSTGGKLVSDCDPCVTQICGQDSYCCSTLWDSICVGEVGSICGQTCN
jgi:hypothetical protein